MISKLKLDRVCSSRWLFLAASVSGLMLGSVVNAGQTAPGNVPVAQPAGNTYPGPAVAPPPPPGPYNAAPGGQQFRPDPDLERSGRHMPPPYPADFSNRNGRGSLTRQQFNTQQEAHRKQMEKYYQQRETEMNKRVNEMQKRMDAMEKQDQARINKSFGNVQPPAAQKMQTPEEVQKRWAREDAEQKRLWEQQKAQEQKRWKQQKADQEKHMQQLRAEGEKHFKEMKAEQDRLDNAHSQYRPLGETPTPPVGTQATPAPAPQARKQAAPASAPAAPVPAYGYPPRGYGYGYPPPPPYGYGAPVRPYPPYPAPAAGPYQRVR